MGQIAILNNQFKLLIKNRRNSCTVHVHKYTCQWLRLIKHTFTSNLPVWNTWIKTVILPLLTRTTRNRTPSTPPDLPVIPLGGYIDRTEGRGNRNRFLLLPCTGKSLMCSLERDLKLSTIDAGPWVHLERTRDRVSLRYFYFVHCQHSGTNIAFLIWWTPRTKFIGGLLGSAYLHPPVTHLHQQMHYVPSKAIRCFSCIYEGKREFK